LDGVPGLIAWNTDVVGLIAEAVEPVVALSIGGSRSEELILRIEASGVSRLNVELHVKARDPELTVICRCGVVTVEPDEISDAIVRLNEASVVAVVVVTRRSGCDVDGVRAARL